MIENKVKMVSLLELAMKGSVLLNKRSMSSLASLAAMATIWGRMLGAGMNGVLLGLSSVLKPSGWPLPKPSGLRLHSQDARPQGNGERFGRRTLAEHSATKHATAPTTPIHFILDAHSPKLEYQQTLTPPETS